MSNSKRLEKLISDNCPKDEVIAFVIGKDSLFIPTADDICRLFEHIPVKVTGGEKVVKRLEEVVSDEALENFILKVRNDEFSCRNLQILWNLAKNRKKRLIMNSVLIGLGIGAAVLIGAIFATGNYRSDKDYERKERVFGLKPDLSSLNDENVDDDENDKYDERLADEYEFYDEWLERDYELRDIILEDFDFMCRVAQYGPTDDELGIDDDDC